MLNPEKLALLRFHQGLSQNELAGRLGCTKNYISMLENRKQDIPREFYDKWIKALYGQYDYRLTEDGMRKVEENKEKPKGKNEK